MSSISFQEALNRGVLVFDGAMGTEIYRRHVFTNRCFDELCLSMPDMIREIHVLKMLRDFLRDEKREAVAKELRVRLERLEKAGQKGQHS